MADSKVSSVDISIKEKYDDNNRKTRDVDLKMSGEINPNNFEEILSHFQVFAQCILNTNNNEREVEVKEAPIRQSNVVRIPSIIENNNDSDDDFPDLVDAEPIEVKDLHFMNSGTIRETKNHDIPERSYPTIRNAWNNFGSIKFVSCNLNNEYLIVFPQVMNNSPFQAIQLNEQNPEISQFFNHHSWPVCSCPSYHYRNGFPRGGCKHIQTTLRTLLGGNINIIRWENRPQSLAEDLKRYGINEFNWIN
jgi:hypothetical protein